MVSVRGLVAALLRNTVSRLAAGLLVAFRGGQGGGLRDASWHMTESTPNIGFRDKAAKFGWRRTAISAVLQRAEQYLGIHVWAIFSRPAYEAFDLTPEQQRFEYRRLSREDCLAAAQTPGLALSEDFVSAAWARGDECFGAFDDGRLIAYLWRSTDTAPLFDDLWLQLRGSPKFYGYKTLVLPEYRGVRLFQVLRGLFDAEYVERGLTRSVGYVAMRNLPSMASLELDPEHERIGLALVFTRGWRGAWVLGRAREHIRLERRPEDVSTPEAVV